MPDTKDKIDAMDVIIEDLSYYDQLPPTTIYVKDLATQGWNLLRHIGKNGDDHKLYWYTGRTSGKAVRFFAIDSGHNTPVLKYIKWYNGVILCDYSRFDSGRGINLSVDEMRQNMKILATTFGFAPLTPTSAIKHLIEKYANPLVQYDVIEHDREGEWDEFIAQALIGGSSIIQPRYLKKTISRETHIDYHQIYGSVLNSPNCLFPRQDDSMQVYDCFVDCRGGCGIYIFGEGSYAQVKPYGYALFGQYLDLAAQALCSVDYETLIENYDVFATCSHTLKWNKVWHGGKDFVGPLVDLIYQARLKYKGTAAEGVFKVYNEILPGFFSRSTYFNANIWRSNLTTGQLNKDGKNYKSVHNPKIGVFINAYARSMLNNLLHRLPYDKVIGWDTDAAFFKGTPDQVPTAVKVLYGALPGQLHLDGNYSNVYHKAPKSYWGWDEDKQQQFSKHIGVPTTGKIATWNAATSTFDIKDHKHDNITRK